MKNLVLFSAFSWVKNYREHFASGITPLVYTVRELRLRKRTRAHMKSLIPSKLISVAIAVITIIIIGTHHYRINYNDEYYSNVTGS